ncbi:MAG: tetratricopeptide repeat protein [Planctomycetales bacterium]
MSAQPEENTGPTPNQRKIATDCFKKGSEAALKKNWGYAVSMFRQAVDIDSANLLFRQSLRGSQEKQYNDNGKGAMMASMKLMPIRASMKTAKYKKDWKNIQRLAEDGIAINPWDAGFNADLGEAAKNLGNTEIAVFAYERAVKHDKDNLDYLRTLAGLYEERGNFESAIGCYRRVLAIDKLDSSARTKITQLQAQSVMERGGYDTATDTRDVMADHEVQKRLKLGEASGPGASQEVDLKHAIRKDPANKDNYLKLAAILRRGGKLEEAKENLQLALDASGGDISIREQMEDVELDMMRAAVQAAKDAYLADKENPDKKQHYAALSNELILREISVYDERVRRYPADSRLKFELAKRYFSQKKYEEAIPHFQQSRGDNRIKGEAFLYLGKCFIAKKEYSLAKRQLEQAIPEINYDDFPDQFKEAHYYLGRVHEQLKDVNAAIAAYQEVLAVDYNYQDIRDRIQKLEKGESAP